MNLVDAHPGAPAQRVEELRAVLEEQSAALDRRDWQLAELSQCILACDNGRMEGLLARMEEAQALQSAADARLDAARRRLAESLGRPPGQVRLAELIGLLPAADGAELARLRARILQQVQRLRRQHLQTAVLLSESARINRLLIQCLQPERPAVTLYDRGRCGDWRAGAGFLDEAR